jgi:hypothetical protein
MENSQTMRITPGSCNLEPGEIDLGLLARWGFEPTPKGMAGSGLMSRNVDDLNIQLRQWPDTAANRWLHATTHRVVNEALAEECRREGRKICVGTQAILTYDNLIEAIPERVFMGGSRNANFTGGFARIVGWAVLFSRTET